ncbi:hypothetical protein BH10PSE9_BH10PSE9_06130 [soil metagenome]
MAIAAESGLPLASVGIPTYNRPAGLRRTIAAMRVQTWGNLEIVISDNGSPDPEVEAVCRSAAAEDPRIRYVRQTKNLGARANFEFVLREARGEYFVWAADDDTWEPFFIERCVKTHLALGPSVALVQMAVPVTVGDHVFPLLNQGAGFHAAVGGTSHDRIANLLRNAYANLVYGVARHEALFQPGKRTVDIGNEMQLLVFVAAQGEIIALPEVGMYKGIPRKKVYDHQHWEIEGGLRPQWWRPRNVFKMLRYHRQVLASIRDALNRVDLTEIERASLDALATKILRRHALHMAINWIPPAASAKARL